MAIIALTNGHVLEVEESAEMIFRKTANGKGCNFKIIEKPDHDTHMGTNQYGKTVTLFFDHIVYYHD